MLELVFRQVDLLRVVIHTAHQLTHHHSGKHQSLNAQGFTGPFIQKALLNHDCIHRLPLEREQFHNSLTGFHCTEING